MQHKKNKDQYVFIWNINGNIITSDDADYVKRNFGCDTEAEMIVSAEEFDSKNGIVNLIDGKIVLGLPDDTSNNIEADVSEGTEEKAYVSEEKVTVYDFETLKKMAEEEIKKAEKSKDESVLKELQQSLSTAMPKHEYSELKLKEIKHSSYVRFLQNTDYVAIKIAEGSATYEEYKDIIDERRKVRDKINAINAEIEALMNKREGDSESRGAEETEVSEK